jgi:hypothetical protein
VLHPKKAGEAMKSQAPQLSDLLAA